MVRRCTHTHSLLVGKPGGKRPLGRTRRRWEDKIKLDPQLRHPRCVNNNEVEYNEGQNTTKFISKVIAVALIKHVSTYSEAIIRLTKL